ncbi:MAG: hypothetical protein LAQ69_39725 [Acidobacteriia bacterium]|nr:hypothetical protein [Terriglobia bacterium]
MLYLTDQKFLQAEIKKTQNEEHITEARMAVRIGEKAVDEIEKKRKRILAAIENTDDASLSDRLKELNGDLANAKARVRNAQAEISDVGQADIEAMARKIALDFSGFMEMPMERKKAILASYVERLTISRHEATDALQVSFKVKAAYPSSDEAGRDPAPEEVLDAPAKPQRRKKCKNTGAWLVDGDKIRPSGSMSSSDCRKTVGTKSESPSSRTSWMRASSM